MATNLTSILNLVSFAFLTAVVITGIKLKRYTGRKKEDMDGWGRIDKVKNGKIVAKF